VKVTLPDAWFLLRGSNTEPVLRVVAEASGAEAARGLAAKIRDRVTEWLA
jgi:phosphomannomutase